MKSDVLLHHIIEPIIIAWVVEKFVTRYISMFECVNIQNIIDMYYMGHSVIWSMTLYVTSATYFRQPVLYVQFPQLILVRIDSKVM